MKAMTLSCLSYLEWYETFADALTEFRRALMEGLLVLSWTT